MGPMGWWYLHLSMILTDRSNSIKKCKRSILSLIDIKSAFSKFEHGENKFKLAICKTNASTEKTNPSLQFAKARYKSQSQKSNVLKSAEKWTFDFWLFFELYSVQKQKPKKYTNVKNPLVKALTYQHPTMAKS